MKRVLIGLFFGIVLTAQGIAFTGAGHGSYALLACASSISIFMPLLALPAGPLLWALYFLFIPNLDKGWQRVSALSAVLAFHIGFGVLIAFQDPAFTQIGAFAISIFSASLLATLSCLLFFTLRKSSH
jgi:hypothetical protein